MLKLLLFLIPIAAQAQFVAHLSIPIKAIAHPVKAYHSVPADTKWMALATTLIEDANAIDYATTRRGAFPGTHGCELNPLLTSAPCQIDVPRFTGIKIGVAAFGVAQWVPIWTRRPWAGGTYKRVFTVLDFAGLVPLAVADANNIHQLTK